MLGTIVNTVAVLVGGGLGLLLRGGLKENYVQIINQAVGLAVLFVGVAGSLRGLLDDAAHPVLFIAALALGALLGEWLRIEGRLQALGDKLQQRLGGAAESRLSEGFVAASLLFCVGTMAVIGSLESGVNGNHSVLYAKSLLDCIIALVMASTLGAGVLLSAASVLLYQGALTLLAGWVSPYLTGDMLREIGIVGGILIATIGLNMLKITNVRVGNMLPTMLAPVLYYAVLGAFYSSFI